jgi:hypothetical protein
MTIKFLADNTPTRAVTATVEVDDEGDLTLRLNGVKVLYLDNDDGAISRFDMDPRDAQRLQDAGINVDGGLLRIDG